MCCKKWKLALLGLLLIVSITGCEDKGPTKAEQESATVEVVNKMVEAAKDASVTQMDCRTQLENTIVSENGKIDWEIILETTSKYDRENFMAFTEGTVKNFSGDDSEVELKTYMLVEEDKLNIYNNAGNYVWYKYDSKMKPEEISKNPVEGLDWGNMEVMGMDVDTHIINGRENYKLTIKLYGEDAKDFIFESGLKGLVKNRQYATLDLKDVEIRADYYVDCENYLVSKMVVNFNEMQPVSDWMDELYYGDTAELKFDKCQMIYTNILYDKVDVPKLDFELKKNAVEVLQEDVLFTIEESGLTANVKGKAGWVVTTLADDGITMNSPDALKFITCYVGINSTLEEWEINIEKITLKDMKADGAYVSHERVEEDNGYVVYYVKTTTGMIAYSRVQIGEADEYVILYAGEQNTDNMDGFFEEAMEGVDW